MMLEEKKAPLCFQASGAVEARVPLPEGSLEAAGAALFKPLSLLPQAAQTAPSLLSRTFWGRCVSTAGKVSALQCCVVGRKSLFSWS